VHNDLENNPESIKDNLDKYNNALTLIRSSLISLGLQNEEIKLIMNCYYS
jgi:hypothetical protein